MHRLDGRLTRGRRDPRCRDPPGVLLLSLDMVGLAGPRLIAGLSIPGSGVRYMLWSFLGLMVYLDPDLAVGSLHQTVGPGEEMPVVSLPSPVRLPSSPSSVWGAHFGVAVVDGD